MEAELMLGVRGGAAVLLLEAPEMRVRMPLVAFFFLVVWPGAPGSVLAPSSMARSP